MRQIALCSLRLTSFRSFVQPTVIELTNGAGLKLISGQNLLEPALGGNGCGKSSFWDGVAFVAYGTSIKGLRAADLTSYGKRSIEGRLVIQVDDVEHTIVRISPPMRLYLDGQLTDQEAVDRLLGMSRSRFLNSVIFGQAVPLFIDLPVPQRGDLLDEVLDLELWMRAADLASNKHIAQSRDLVALQTEIAHIRGQIEGLPNPSELRRLEIEWQSRYDAQMARLIEQHEAVIAQCRALEVVQQQELPQAIGVGEAKVRYDRASERLTSYRNRLAVAESQREQLQEQLDFFNENTECPTCRQGITENFRNAHIAHLREQLEVHGNTLLVLASRIAAGQTRRESLEGAWQALIQDYNTQQRARAVALAELAGKEREEISLQNQIAHFAAENNPYTEQHRQAAEALRALNQQLTDKRDEERDLIDQLASLNFWKQGFRRVRLFCLENVLRELTIEARNALLALGLIDWQVSFKTATETKSGTVKLGVQVDVTAPNNQRSKFDVLSGGESQRARLAVSLGLANLVQRWAGVRYNLEVWDEPTAFLSVEGVDSLLECLAYRAESQDKSIWVCDHRSLDAAFSERWMVTKDVQGSHWGRA